MKAPPLVPPAIAQGFAAVCVVLAVLPLLGLSGYYHNQLTQAYRGWPSSRPEREQTDDADADEPRIGHRDERHRHAIENQRPPQADAPAAREIYSAFFHK